MEIGKGARIALRYGLILGMCVMSAVVGGALSRNVGVSTYTLSYADFISIMLTACSVLLTLVTIFLAVLGVMGWNAIANGVKTRTEKFLEEGFQPGSSLYAMVQDRVTKIMFEGVGSAENEADDTTSEGKDT